MMNKIFYMATVCLIAFVMVLGVSIISNPLNIVVSTSNTCPCGSVGINHSGTRDITIRWSGQANIFAIANFRSYNPQLYPEGAPQFNVSGHHGASVDGQNSRIIPFSNLFDDDTDEFREQNTYRVSVRCIECERWANHVFTLFRDSKFMISATTDNLDFGSLLAGYMQPSVRTVTVKNTGNENITLNRLPIVESWTLVPADNWTTVMPPNDLPLSCYSNPLVV
jgi:hypothetical protein